MPFFEYLRVSITDRCNLRCVYCMPEEGIPKLGHDQVLRYEEILTIVKAAMEEGVFRIRVTGGEPLVRKGVSSFLTEVARVPGLRDLALTTNGMLLKEMASSLKIAGLMRVNVSLDSLQPERFAKLTRGGDLMKVLEGIRVATEQGLHPVKVNCVLLPGENDGEILDFAQFAYSNPVQIRFIERMPFRGTGAETLFVNQEEIRHRISERFVLEPTDQKKGGGPAELFSLKGGKGQIGFISSRSNPFCHKCTRLRLTAAGVLMPCLDQQKGIQVRGKSIEEIREIIRNLGKEKQAAGKGCPTFQQAGCISLSDIGG